MNQTGFIGNWGTIHSIYGAWLLMKKHRGDRQPLYIAFLDLEKVFDRINGTVIVTGRDLPKTERFKYLATILRANTMKLLHASAQLR